MCQNWGEVWITLEHLPDVKKDQVLGCSAPVEEHFGSRADVLINQSNSALVLRNKCLHGDSRPVKHDTGSTVRQFFDSYLLFLTLDPSLPVIDPWS